MTTLVTGGAGYIGSHTVYALLDRGDKVVVGVNRFEESEATKAALFSTDENRLFEIARDLPDCSRDT